MGGDEVCDARGLLTMLLAFQEPCFDRSTCMRLGEDHARIHGCDAGGPYFPAYFNDDMNSLHYHGHA